MKYLTTIFLSILAFCVHAQKGNNEVVKGNEAYKKGDFKTAEASYSNALKVDEKNATALFNKGNAMQRQGNSADALKQYEAATEKSNDASVQSKAFYNKGVIQARQKQWAEAVNSFKQALRLKSDDNDTRDNLQKAMAEVKKEQEKKKENKENDKKKPEDKPKEKKKDEPKMNKQQMENELNRLRNEEKQLQQNLQKQRPKTSSNDKDW